MRFISGEVREQATLFPDKLDDYIGEESEVRFIEVFVESLDLGKLGFERVEPKATGRPAYDPRDLLKLYIYGYLNRIRTSRRLEIETGRNLELMWLMRKLRPDFKTIADFRKDNSKALKKTFREFIMICRKLELFGGDLVAVDGSKFRASNSKKKNFTTAKLKDLVRRTDKRIEEYLKRLDEGDRDDGSNRLSGEELKEKIEKLKQMREQYRENEQKLAESGETQISLTDPDARLMQSAQGKHVSYNVQMAVDSKHKLVAALEVTNEANDEHQLSAITNQAKEALGVEELAALADKGYYECDQIKECSDNGITPYVVKPAAKVIEGVFSKEKFEYNAEKDIYVCPAGEVLTFRTTDKQRQLKIYKTDACGGCGLKSQCTKSKGPREIKRHVHESVMEEMAKRVASRREMLKMRAGLVEHPWGTMKRLLDHGYFLMRGSEKVAAEISLIGLVYNMKRVLNIVGVANLIKALG